MIQCTSGTPISEPCGQRMKAACSARPPASAMRSLTRSAGAEWRAACAAAWKHGPSPPTPGSRRTAAAGVAVETSLITIEDLDERIPEAIADDAEAWSADLIVIGTHGRRGLSRLFLGSIAEGVIRVATKPVLLIRGK
mgnify:CR=1 FL=1